MPSRRALLGSLGVLVTAGCSQQQQTADSTTEPSTTTADPIHVPTELEWGRSTTYDGPSITPTNAWGQHSVITLRTPDSFGVRSFTPTQLLFLTVSVDGTDPLPRPRTSLSTPLANGTLAGRANRTSRRIGSARTTPKRHTTQRTTTRPVGSGSGGFRAAVPEAGPQYAPHAVRLPLEPGESATTSVTTSGHVGTRVDRATVDVITQDREVSRTVTLEYPRYGVDRSSEDARQLLLSPRASRFDVEEIP